MNRRLACVDIPGPALQFLLHDVPDWKDSPVVLLDRDEANGRIIDLNQAARDLGIGRGMLYGPCLGIHKSLKGGVLPDMACKTRLDVIETILRKFSPFVEQAWFQEGTFWMDATGLAHLFGSVRSWLSGIRTALEDLDLECGLSAGSGRFSTFAAARLKPMGFINIFTDAETEAAWLREVPVNILEMKEDTMKLFRRLKLITVGHVLEIPVRDISHRLSKDAAELVGFIREESSLPLQYRNEVEPVVWEFHPEESMVQLNDLIVAGCSLADRCIERSNMDGIPVQSMEFCLSGSEVDYNLEIKPARPTRKRELLHRLLASRFEYARIMSPITGIRCRGVFAASTGSQQNLFDSDHHRNRREADRVLATIQAERGPMSVQYAEPRDDPHPARQFQLRSWNGFPSRSAVNVHTCTPDRKIIRRIRITPGISLTEPPPAVRFSYTGGWWNRPYHHEMGYLFHHGRTEWLQGLVSGDRVEKWELIGWVD